MLRPRLQPIDNKKLIFPRGLLFALRKWDLLLESESPKNSSQIRRNLESEYKFYLQEDASATWYRLGQATSWAKSLATLKRVHKNWTLRNVFLVLMTSWLRIAAVKENLIYPKTQRQKGHHRAYVLDLVTYMAWWKIVIRIYVVNKPCVLYILHRYHSSSIACKATRSRVLASIHVRDRRVYPIGTWI